MRMGAAAASHYEMTLLSDAIVQIVTLSTTIGDKSKVESDARNGSLSTRGQNYQQEYIRIF